MQSESSRASDAAARALALLVTASGRIDDRTLLVLDESDAYRRVGVVRDHFIALARTCISEVGANLCERSWLRESDLRYLDRLLDAVTDPQQQLLVCRLAAPALATDGCIIDGEHMVYEHALARWHISPSAVAPPMPTDAPH
jgi:hypothetical protein